MGIYKAEAIVLRSMVYKEADRILTLFTREEGKVSAIARGVRKTTSRLRGAVQLFSHTHLVLYSGRSLDTVSQGDAEEHFSYLEQDLERFSTASYCAELVDRLTQAREQQPKVFFLLLSALRALKNGNPELTARVFELKLLDILGFCPSLTECVVGNHPFSIETEELKQVWFNIEEGGIVCPACAENCEGVRSFSPATLGALGYFLRAPLEQAIKAKLNSHVLRELAGLLQGFLTYHGDARLRSRSFLDAFRNEDAGNGHNK
ncbi:MAG: DNA repair protein RecO [Syntrophaceticus sp.]|jgi:DNA repair protein RecO (recombination protein O)